MLPVPFIELMLPHAQASMKKYRVPASFTIAQAAIETGKPGLGWGATELALKAFNYFGIKADAGWHGDKIMLPTGEYINGEHVVIEAAFRKYPDLATGVDDHGLFLTTNPRYQPAFAHVSDAEAFTTAVAQAGWATGPAYANAIITTIRAHNLTQYDQPTT